jgi:hypothetical protein
VLALPLLPSLVLATLLVPALVPAFLFAPVRTRAMLRRARWLLLSIAVLFAFATPGLAVPGWPGQAGMTQDGLLLAAEHLARLVALLATLALLHERLGTAASPAGSAAARTASVWEGWRERIVVRLMLVVGRRERPSAAAGANGWEPTSGHIARAGDPPAADPLVRHVGGRAGVGVLGW